ncbi:hypothetical protein ACP4OV_007005 [Aristida adscensionis]
MASSGPSSSRARPPPAASNSGALPPDVLFDVLLRLPARELCRLCAVCRSWRLLTSDPLFVGAHAARHPDPLFLAKFRDDGAHVNVVDLSGNVVKRIPSPEGHLLFGAHLDLACVYTRSNSCRLLNPATGAAYALPETPAPVHASDDDLQYRCTLFVCGRAASTGEYKVLRMFNRLDIDGYGQQQLFEVFTVNGADGSAAWRARQSRDRFVEANCVAVVGRVVYFLMDCVYDMRMFTGLDTGIHPDCIASFDLGTEEWRRDIQGPISRSLVMENADAREEYLNIWRRLTLGNLKGSLVLVYHSTAKFIMDLWFLMDFENDLWVKEYTIQTESAVPALSEVYPLLVLSDGRLVIYLELAGVLLICDPVTNTFTEVGMRQLDAIGMYTGSLLSLPCGDMV